MTAGAEAAPGGVVGGGPYGVPRGHRRGLRPRGVRPDHHDRLRPVPLRRPVRLADRRPEGFEDLPAFRGDDLDPARCGGDIGIQACANDPQVAVHAIRNLVRIGFGTVSVRWSQLGFGRTSSTSTTRSPPGTCSGSRTAPTTSRPRTPTALAEHVWVQPADVPGRAAWMAGGSYLVARRIRMHIEVWDRTTCRSRSRSSAATRARAPRWASRREFDAVDFAKPGADGKPAIPVDAHIRLAHASCLEGIRLLRRGYNFTDGTDGVGHLDAGLFFIALLPGRRQAVRADAEGARPAKDAAQRVHRAHRVGGLRLPAGRQRPAGTGARRSSAEGGGLLARRLGAVLARPVAVPAIGEEGADEAVEDAHQDVAQVVRPAVEP